MLPIAFRVAQQHTKLMAFIKAAEELVDLGKSDTVSFPLSRSLSN